MLFVSTTVTKFPFWKELWNLFAYEKSKRSGLLNLFAYEKSKA
jgi:hypothetical protein